MVADAMVQVGPTPASILPSVHALCGSHFAPEPATFALQMAHPAAGTVYEREKPEVSLPSELNVHWRKCLPLAARLHEMQASLCLALQAPAGERRGLRLGFAEDRHAPLQPSQGNSQVSAGAEYFGACCAALVKPGV